ncbi:peptidase inhibitor family I36 protein [Streptomyces sp. NPDC005423]|uniref:peptidase inhibitor family I36 protein n=1 Tax=Streptomyces sp. NPDC005423 TaxID=3155343 RepID=UPI0033B56863
MRKFFSFASAIATVAAVALPAAAPAQATESQCSAGQFCVWSEANFNGQFKVAQAPLGKCFSPQTTWPNGTNTRIGAISNRTQFQIEGFDNGQCSGQASSVLKPNTTAGSIGASLQTIRLVPACDQNQLCFYENADFSGKTWAVSGMTGTLCYNATATNAQAPHAAYNRDYRSMKLWTTQGFCGGPNYVLPSGQWSGFNDAVYAITP